MTVSLNVMVLVCFNIEISININRHKSLNIFLKTTSNLFIKYATTGIRLLQTQIKLHEAIPVSYSIPQHSKTFFFYQTHLQIFNYTPNNSICNNNDASKATLRSTKDICYKVAIQRNADLFLKPQQ